MQKRSFTSVQDDKYFKVILSGSEGSVFTVTSAADSR
jgi:hypothetical protein